MKSRYLCLCNSIATSKPVADFRPNLQRRRELKDYYDGYVWKRHSEVSHLEESYSLNMF